MHYRAVSLAAAMLVLSLAPLPVRAQAPDAARLGAAKEMMQVAGVARQFEEVMPLLLEQLARGFVAVAPDKAWEIRDVLSQLGTKFNDRKGQLIDQVAALYAGQLSLEELAAIVEFYRSPAGAKLLSVQPQVMRQAILLGQRWGAELGREIEEEARKELKKRGIDL